MDSSRRADLRFRTNATGASRYRRRRRVLITAHGISDQRAGGLEAAGKQIVDTTCPLVTRVHQAARTLQARGYHVLVIGRRGHVEVEGITGDLERFDVIESVEDVDAIPIGGWGSSARRRRPRRVASIRAAIAARNPDAEIGFVDTVCLPTKEHQRALERLLDRVEAVVVVGGATRTTRASWPPVAASGASRRFTSSRPPSSSRHGSRGTPRSA